MSRLRLEKYERRVYSQNGEDGVLEWLAAYTPHKHMVEIGSSNGLQCNSRNLVQGLKWTAVLVDALFGDWVTAENVNQYIDRPTGILSIDVDGNDYWIWKAVMSLPDIVVVEYNPWLELKPVTMAYDPNHKWDCTDNYGASISALWKLGQAKGYQCLGCESRGVNAFFIRRELGKGLPDLSAEDAYRPSTRRSKGAIKPDRFVEV